MDVELSDDQCSLQEATQRFLKNECPLATVRAWAEEAGGIDPGWWRRAAQLGWTAMLVPEEHGGGNVSGEGLADLAIIAEEIGGSVAPGPLVPTNVVADALARSGTDEQKQEHLPKIVEGIVTAGWCVEPFLAIMNSQRIPLEVRIDEHELVLNGAVAPVEWFNEMELVLVTACKVGKPTQVMTPTSAPGLSIVPMRSVDLVNTFVELRFDNVRLPRHRILGEPGDASEAVRRQLRIAGLLSCAEIVGTARRVFDLTLEYLNTRYSFGRPLASYQALKHRFADMKMWLEAAQAISQAATRATQADAGDAQTLVSAAKAYVSERMTELIQECVQMHGGIAMTWEHDLHLYLRRATLHRNLYGTPNEHRRIIGLLEGV